MSSKLSLLNASSSSKSEEFNLKDIEVLVDSKQQHWFKRSNVGKFWGLLNIHRSTEKLVDEDQKTRAFLQAEGGCHIITPPKKNAQDHDIFMLLTGALYVIVNSRNDKGQALKKYILKDIVPRGFDATIEEIQKEHNQQTKHSLAAFNAKDIPVVVAVMISPSLIESSRFFFQSKLLIYCIFS